MPLRLSAISRRYDSAPKKLLVLGVGLATLILGGAAITETPETAAVVAVISAGSCVVLGLVVWLFPDRGFRSRVFWWTAASLLLHLAIGVAILHVRPLNDYFAGDSFGYHQDAVALTRHWASAGPSVDLTAGKEGYAFVLGALYWIVGPVRDAGVALNCLAAAALVPLVTASTLSFFGREVAGRVPLLMTLIPAFLIWPAQLLKEASVLLLIAVLMACIARMKGRIPLSAGFILAIGLALLLTFRVAVAVGIAGGLALSVIFRQRKVSLIAGLLTITAALGIVIWTGVGAPGLRTASTANLEQASTVREGNSVGANSAFGEDVDISSAPKALAQLPAAVARFTLGPFPWEIRAISQLPALTEWLIWVGLLVPFRRGIGILRRRGDRRASPLLLSSAMVLLLLAPVIGNYGLLLRERTQILIMLLPVIALGLRPKRSHQYQPQFLPSHLTGTRARQASVGVAR